MKTKSQRKSGENRQKYDKNKKEKRQKKTGEKKQNSNKG